MFIVHGSSSEGGDQLKKDEAIAGVVIFLFGLITTVLSLRMPVGSFRMAGTGMFPLILGILLMILSGTSVLKIFFQGKDKKTKKEASIESSESLMQLILFFGVMVLATLFFNRLGYLLTSLLLMLALLRTLGVKKWTFILPLSLMTAIACYFLFVRWLQIPLPKGWIGI